MGGRGGRGEGEVRCGEGYLLSVIVCGCVGPWVELYEWYNRGHWCVVVVRGCVCVRVGSYQRGTRGHWSNHRNRRSIIQPESGVDWIRSD